MGGSQELSNKLRERRRTHTSTLSQAGEKVVAVGKVDRRGVGVDDVASAIARKLHHGPKQERTLGGAFVKEKEVQQGRVVVLKFEEAG